MSAPAPAASRLPLYPRLADLGFEAHAVHHRLVLLVELLPVMDAGHPSLKKAAKELERRRNEGLLPESVPVSESSVGALKRDLAKLVDKLFGGGVVLFAVMYPGGPAVPTGECRCLARMGREYLGPA